MARTIQGNPKFQAVDGNGNPRAGAKLFTYQADTTTKKATYQDHGLVSANSNPIVLDANGEATVWLDGVYKFVLAPANDTDPPMSPYWTEDYIGQADNTAIVSNQLLNGSFEYDTTTANLPDNWTLTGSATFALSTIAYSGARALEISDAAGTATSDFIVVSPALTYELVFSDRYAGSLPIRLVSVEEYDINQGLLVTTNLSVVNYGSSVISGMTSSYKKLYSTVTLGNSTAYVKLKFYYNVASGAKAYLDGVEWNSLFLVKNYTTVSSPWTFTSNNIFSGQNWFSNSNTFSKTNYLTGNFEISAIDQILTDVAVVDSCIIDTTRDTNPDWIDATKHLSYGTESVPSGSFVGRYANETVARAAGGVADDWYARTGSTTFYRLDGSSGETQIYRAGQAKFPKLGLAVAEADKVVIYDLTRSTPQMWMVFDSNALNTKWIYYSAGRDISAVAYAEGVLAITQQGGSGALTLIDFGLDVGKQFYNVPGASIRFPKGISSRNTWDSTVSFIQGALVARSCNDVAITVLPTAPVKVNGLKEPTIAVGTNGGTSIIKDDGNIWDITEAGYNEHRKVAINNTHVWVLRKQDATDSWVMALCNTPTADTTISASIVHYNSAGYSSTAVPTNINNANDINGIAFTDKIMVEGQATQGLTTLYRGAALSGNQSNVIWNNVTKDYCTGWLHGDIRRALLANSLTADRSVKASTMTHAGGGLVSTLISGSDIFAYSGFTSTNYLSQAYSADLDFGTGDFSFSFWGKTTTSSVLETLICRGYYSGGWSGGGQIAIEINSSSYLAIGISDDNWVTSDTLTSTFVIDDGQYHKYDVVRLGTIVYLYIDGVLNGSVTLTAAAATLNNASGTLRMGYRQDASNAAVNSTLSLVRISATAPTANQIKYAYETELPIFQGNPCLLSGSSDDVLTVAYDQVKDTVHAGTSSGRSEFKGLVRVGYEATPVGNPTSIVAHADIVSNGGASGSDLYMPTISMREKAIEAMLQDKDADDEGWKYPTLLNNWVNYGGAEVPTRYRKLANGQVEVQGLVKSGTTSTTVFSLPVGYRPKYNMVFAGVNFNGATYDLHYTAIGSNGSVLSIDNAGNTWVSLNCTFTAEQ